VNNTPLSHAVALGADQAWVLPTGYSCALPTAPQSALTMALHAVTLAVNHRLAVDIDRFEPAIDLHVIRPLCPVAVSGTDFSHADLLIEQSHAATRKWLASCPPTTGQAQLLAPHRH
jgi:NTE family protein